MYIPDTGVKHLKIFFAIFQKTCLKNFNNLKIDNSINKNTLSINSIYNLTVTNNNIAPAFNFSDLLSSFIKKEDLNTFILNNQSLIDNIIYATTYTFYDIDSSSNIERVFVVDKTHKLYELDFVNLIFNYLNIQTTNEDLIK